MLQPKYDVGQRFWAMYCDKPREVEITCVSVYKLRPSQNPEQIKETVTYDLQTYDPIWENGRLKPRYLNRVGSGITEEKIKEKCFSTKEECIKSLY